jgi:glycerol-3-phosphate dehydrogenase (NAD(P)+)
MSSGNRIAVLGAGAWASTVAWLLAQSGRSVLVWARELEVVREINSGHTNRRYLPEARLPVTLSASESIAETLAGREVVLFGLPVQSLRDVARQAAQHLSGTEILINLGKALEHGSFARPAQILQQEIRQCQVFGTLSGPNIAQEVYRRVPSKAVIACTDFMKLDELRQMFDQDFYRVSTNPDLTGVELAGALKNVYAIMAGIGDGLGFGENTKGALLSRALNEMVKVGTLMGGNRDTFYGIAGAGDLFATASSPHSRNRRLGEALVKTGLLDAATKSLAGRVAEGIETTYALQAVREKLKLEMPVAEELYEILFAGKSCAEGFKAVWARSPGSELS